MDLPNKRKKENNCNFNVLLFKIIENKDELNIIF
jgi:hypothetical protein